MLMTRVILLGLVSMVAMVTVTETTVFLENSTMYITNSSYLRMAPMDTGVDVTDSHATSADLAPPVENKDARIPVKTSVLPVLMWSVAAAFFTTVLVVAMIVGWVFVTLGFDEVQKIITATSIWWRGLAHYWWFGGSYADFSLCADSLESRVYIRSIALAMKLWSLPHYRNGNFQEDMEKNLRNVAIPGTGVPLSVFCRSQFRFFFAVLILAPLACLYAAMIDEDDSKKGVAERYEQFLLRPQDWFTLWRINCCLASYHAHVTGSTDYVAEDKWTFLKMAEEKGIAVSPTLDLPAIVVKDRNEEGGMGINFYQNARHGGDWILQKVLYNAPFVENLLPTRAPLSTIRIVTASRVGLEESTGADVNADLIEPLSCVLRLGRANAMTDHDAILYDANVDTGLIREGTVNKSWYQLGWSNATLSAPVGPARFTSHPDSGVTVAGRTIPNMSDIRKLVKQAHFECCPEVPLCGWDVALTNEGTLLLEVNLSCNFFQATIDRANYFHFVNDYFEHLEKLCH
mmetsp:Transcript_145252/g.205605  ORF Transcript_145252/g.205605 Transcript_145252/m.205605 type:complete len:516 (-) Transcript_145252:57-1604(-)